MYTIRCKEKFYADSKSFGEYPFEKSMFRFKFEIPGLATNFGGEKVKIFFDYYPTLSDEEIRWKDDNVDNLPEHHIDFLGTKIYCIEDVEAINP